MRPFVTRLGVLGLGCLTWIALPQANAATRFTPTTAHARNPATISTKIDNYLKGLAGQNQLSGAVLVAQQGRVLLARGYGLADREKRVANAAATHYPLVAGFTTIVEIAAVLRLEGQGKLHETDSLCSYLAGCPQAWKTITIRGVLAGTDALGQYDPGQRGKTPAQALRACQAHPSDRPSGTSTDYSTCSVLVLGALLERVLRQPWLAAVRNEVLRPAGMTQTVRATDALRPPARARDYAGAQPDGRSVYNDTYGMATTVGDFYAFDRALFNGKLLSQTLLARMLMPRHSLDSPDPGITAARWGYRWKIGRALGRQVDYLTGGTNDFFMANLYFPEGNVTVVVIENDDTNDALGAALHSASIVFARAAEVRGER